MKKTKLLLLSLLTLASSSMWGQNWEDITSTYLDNAGFDIEEDLQTANLVVNPATTKDVTNWTFAGSTSWAASGCIGFGGTGQINGASIPSTNSNDEATGGALAITGAWDDGNGYASYTQAVTLPAGKYKAEFIVNNVGQNSNFRKSFFGFKTSSKEYYGTTTSFPVSTWTTEAVEFTLTEETEGNISVGFGWAHAGSGSTPKLVIDYVKLYVDNTVDKTNLNTLITEAEGLYLETGNGAATFKTAIDAAKEVSEKATATIAEVLNAETALQAAIDNFKWANASSENPVDITSKIVNADCSSTEGWSPVTCNPNSGQHWDGTTTNKYLEPCNWNANSWTGSALQTISVPNGHYKLVAAGRASEGVTLKLVANSQEVTFETLGDVGGTIATDGTEWSSVAEGISAGKSFANNNGRGWTYKSIDDIIIIDKDLQLGAKSSSSTLHSWCSIDDFKLFYTGPITEADKVPAAKADLLAAIEAKPAISANVGDGAFQYSTANADSYNKILTDAQDVYDNPSATLADVNTAKESVTSATLPTLNGPKANTRYALVLKYDGWTYDNKAVTYIANGRSDAGNYNIQYLTEVNPNYAQAFIFTPVEGDKYTLSQIDADGNERFVCTGVPYGGNTSQIRTTTTADAALLVEVRATATEGKWNLWNTEANNYIGSQDAGVFTVNSHIDFEIVEAKEIPGISVPAVGYATYIAPADVTIPSGVKAYSCDGAEGTTLVLTEVTNTIPKDKPVILIAAGGYSDDTTYGYSNMNPKSETFTEEPLVGTYVDTPAPAGSYVLQNGSEGAKFYKVSDEEGKQPTVKANHVYLYFPASEVKAFALEDATGIETIHNSQFIIHNDDETYNIAGQRVGNDFKGIVIKNGKKQLNK